VTNLLDNSQLTWFLSRASGIVALALLTLSMVLGIVAGTRMSSARWPRFVTQGLHRNISLFVLVLLALHVTAAVVDDYVTITVQESVIPFIGTYRPVWMGLGLLAVAWRIVAGWPRRALLRTSAVLLTACAVAIVFTWARQGPFAPGWSKRSGTTQTTGQK
jgi:succinate dehydrogenase hydrophobic anchor subunit